MLKMRFFNNFRIDTRYKELKIMIKTKKTDLTDKPLSPDLLRKMNAYWRAANYLSVGQIYLFDNPLLK